MTGVVQIRLQQCNRNSHRDFGLVPTYQGAVFVIQSKMKDGDLKLQKVLGTNNVADGHD